MRPLNILLSNALIAALFTLTGCSSGAPATNDIKQDTPVMVVMAKPARSPQGGVTASGQVEAANSATISTRLMGTITHIYVKLGDYVKTGQLLVSIDNQEIKAKRAQTDARIAEAQADLDNARKDLDRYNALFKRQSATATELEKANLRFQSASSSLESAQQIRREIDASVAYANLTAPFAGVVTQKLMDAGSLATPGAPILTLEQNNLLQINATIAESDISRIGTGDKAELEIKSAGLKTTGVVTQISISSIATGGQYCIKIALPRETQKKLIAGMYTNVFIPSKPGQHAGDAAGRALYVPVSALVEKDQLTGIYTVSSMHTALLRWVRTGRRTADNTEILSGLNADESFIINASGKLYNGAPVKEK